MPIVNQVLYIGEKIVNATVGSVIFTGTGAVVAQDNANFFWDDTNNRLGIGTASPGASLDVMINSSSEVGLIIQGAASQSGDLFQCLLSSGTKRSAFVSSGALAFLGATETISSTINLISASGTITLDNASSLITGYNYATSVTYTAAPFLGIIGPFFIFNGNYTFNVAAGAFFQIPTFINFAVYTSATTRNTTLTGAFGAFGDRPTFNVAGTGTWVNTSSYVSYLCELIINTGVTFGTRTGYSFADTTGAGTITTQIGLDIASLTKATNNYAIRTGASGEIRFGNKITLYNNIATVSNGVPSELATVDLTTQGAAIGATTIYTPAATGLFRVSIYLQVTRAATSSSILGGVTLTYNDGDGNVAQTLLVQMNTNGGAMALVNAGNTTATNLNGTAVIYARTGVAIQYAIGYTSVGATTMQYAAHLKVEAL